MNTHEKYFLEILKKPSKKRTERELKKLTDYLCQKEFFAEYAKEGNYKVVYQWAQELSITNFEKDEIIAQYGEIGFTFYMILVGSVDIYTKSEITRDFTFAQYIKFLRDHKGFIRSINGQKIIHYPKNMELIENHPKFLSAEELNQDLLDEIVSDMSDYSKIQIIQTVINKYFTDPIPYRYDIVYLQKHKPLTQGQVFGELALINSKPRSATVIAAEKTTWATLNKTQFKKILQKYEKSRLETMIESLDSFVLFQQFSKIAKTKILKNVTKHIYHKGDYLFYEGDQVHIPRPKPYNLHFLGPSKSNQNEDQDSSLIYFIINGEFELIKKFKVTLQNGKRCIEYDYLKVHPQEFKEHIDFWIKNKVLWRESKEKFKLQNSPKIHRNYKDIILSTINKKHIFGLEDVMLGFKNRFASVKWISKTAEVYSISCDQLSKVFLQYGSKNYTEDEVTQNYAKNNIEFLTQRVEKTILGLEKLNIEDEESKFDDNYQHKAHNIFIQTEENDFVKQLKASKLMFPTKGFVARSSSAIIDTLPQTSYYQQLIKRPRSRIKEEFVIKKAKPAKKSKKRIKNKLSLTKPISLSKRKSIESPKPTPKINKLTMKLRNYSLPDLGETYDGKIRRSIWITTYEKGKISRNFDQNYTELKASDVSKFKSFYNRYSQNSFSTRNSKIPSLRRSMRASSIPRTMIKKLALDIN